MYVHAKEDGYAHFSKLFHRQFSFETIFLQLSMHFSGFTRFLTAFKKSVILYDIAIIFFNFSVLSARFLRTVFYAGQFVFTDQIYHIY